MMARIRVRSRCASHLQEYRSSNAPYRVELFSIEYDTVGEHWNLPTSIRKKDTALRATLAQRFPFYYGWVICAIVSGTSFGARPLMSVAVLSVFVLPMTEAFDWSRSLFSGAVSLGGICAAFISPFVGRLVDKYGAGVMISFSSAVAGLCAVGLSWIQHAWSFYALFVPGRAVFSSPLEIATSTALSNWFIHRRAFVLALFGASQGIGLAAMPLAAEFLISDWGWRQAWLALGVFTLAIGIVPSLLFMVRRPEDMGLEPDPEPQRVDAAAEPDAGANLRPARPEAHFTLQQAFRTRAFWVVAAFSALGFMSQAGVSLHHVSHYVQHGLSGPQAALMAGMFAFSQVPAGLFWSALTRHVPVRYALCMAGLYVAFGALGTAFATTLARGMFAAGALGCGVSGLHLLLRLTWAEYYGRHHLGAIRGVTLPVHIGGQAVGPVTAGLVFDMTGDYTSAFIFFGMMTALGSLMVLTAVPPRAPDLEIRDRDGLQASGSA